jgi:type VI secretion system secreted protein VgrG
MLVDQEDRVLRVRAAAAPDVFRLRRLVASETIEEPFRLHAELVSPVRIQPSRMIGTAITCTIAWGTTGTAERHFHGLISSFGEGMPIGQALYAYRCIAEPRIAFLRASVDCRIFQNSPIQTIVEDVLKARNAGPAKFIHMDGHTAPREYCVQFNETDLDFLQRMLDEAGCTYFFTHSAGDHVFTVTGEAAAAFPEIGIPPLVVREDPNRPDAVTGWTLHQSAHSANQKSWDFDNLTPSALKQSSAATQVAPNGDVAGSSSVYRWPGGQAVRPEAGDTAKLRMRRHEATATSWSGRSQATGLFAGGKIQLQEALATSPRGFLLFSVTHDAFDETGILPDGTAGYANSFAVVPGDRPWRGPVHRPRPTIPGVQSALVVGPSGEEIHVDEYGRIKVHFLWDHLDEKNDETSSCWVRVAQPFAGAWGGAWFLPRIGDEVLVAFLDGDADRPVVIGSLYNADGKPPWELPANQTRSGLRGRSSKTGGRDNRNVIGFDDKMGEEELGISAERDAFFATERDHQFNVGGNLFQEVTGEHPDSPDGVRTTTIKGDETLTIQQGNRVTTISKGNDTLKLDMGNLEIECSLGNITIKVAVGAVTIEALQGITLKSGPTSSVEIKPEGVTISALKITTDAKLLHDNKAAIKQHSGQGMAKFGGAITMIGP